MALRSSSETVSNLPSFLAIKLFRPARRPGHVPRPRLVDRLNEGYAVTLVAAPPGFGKSALIAEWQGSARRAPPLAWLALDPNDNDPARFLTYVCHALGRLEPGLGANALALLQAAPPPPLGLVLTTLLAELEGLAQPAVLVLDDYHVVSWNGPMPRRGYAAEVTPRHTVRSKARLCGLRGAVTASSGARRTTSVYLCASQHKRLYSPVFCLMLISLAIVVSGGSQTRLVG